jgi:ornithine cyclodeaminase/alanine dehydrogenase-like protein (mu-crystallin family)
MIFVSGTRLRELVSMRDAISAVRVAFEKVSNGRIEQPTRLVASGGSAVAMLALDSDSRNCIVKALTVRPENLGAGRPAVQAVVIFFNGQTGTAEAVLDGTSLTALRTGAAAGVATELLAHPNARVLAVIGAGGQCADQIRAVCAVRPISEVRVASRRYGNSVDLVNRLQKELPKVTFVAVRTNTDAIADADVICTVTGSSQQLFDVEGLALNVHINAMGAFTPTMCEIPPEVLRKASVVAVDQLEAAKAEAGDILQAVEGGFLTWANILELGTLAKVSGSASGWTVFKSVGIGAQDLEVAELAVSRARQNDRAETMEIG